MTTKEVIEQIAKSPAADWLNNKAKITLSYDPVNFSQTFTGIPEIHQFLSQQVKGWEKLSADIPTQFEGSKKHFTDLKRKLERFIKSHSQKDEALVNNQWNNEKDQQEWKKKYHFLYEASQTTFLLSIHTKFPNSFLGAYQFIVKGSFQTNTKDALIGTLLAYEYELKDHTEITLRRDKEKASISKIRNEFAKLLTQSAKELADHFTTLNKEHQEYTEALDELKQSKETLFDNWFTEAQKNFSSLEEGSKQTFSELSKIYNEKLKLEAPARYWSSKSTKYYKDGKRARNILLCMVGISAAFLATILTIAPDWIFKEVFNNNFSSAIRWTLVFITLISLLAFGIRAITKIMFSSFHLARDAEERHTLSFFYLALLKDTEIKEEDRHLILQSLFSRTDTGLLKDDGSPTMPNDVIGKLLNK